MPSLARARKSWQALSPKSPHVPVAWHAGTKIRVHHSVTRQPRGVGRKLVRDEQQRMRDIQRIAFGRGYSDFSYNIAIMPSGRRYWGRGPEVLGAHTLGHNTDIGVVLVGNYDLKRMPIAMRVSFWQLRKQLRKRYRCSTKVHPHSDTFPTACPGKYAKKALGL